MSPHPTDLSGLLAFLDDSPTSRHAAERSVATLEAAGFVREPLEHAFTNGRSRHLVQRAGTVIAWQSAASVGNGVPLRIAAAHTDSPGLRLKPNPVTTAAGCLRLGVEVYGSPLLNSWLDRDLGLAGAVLSDDADTPVRLVCDPSPVLRIPQLAIHLNRGVNETGLKVDRQHHLQPLWGLGTDADAFRTYVAELAGLSPSAIRGWDLAPFDLTPARVVGRDDAFLASARLDDLLSCHAALRALIATEPSDEVISVVVLVDHEEVGSTSSNGAAGTFVAQILERIALSMGGSRADHLVSLASSHGISIDMAHATHPNHPERHDPAHPILLDAGPVVKHNAQQRYATSVESMGPFLAACDRADVPVQHFVSHSEMPCGSTIGPSLAASLGIPVVDVGIAQLAMHSTREMCGSRDHDRLVSALSNYLSRA